MKCIKCACEFELTKEEARVHEYLPYCSEECYLSTLNDKSKDSFVRQKRNRIAKAKAVGKEIDEHFGPYHVGPRGDAPKVGIKGERIVNIAPHGKPKWKKIEVNVGGELKVHPFTDDLRALAAYQYGRTGFSEGCTVCILPSSVFYGRFPEEMCR